MSAPTIPLNKFPAFLAPAITLSNYKSRLCI